VCRPHAVETCLFTGEALTPTTKVEHTIPRALGGRIRSQVVSCDRFNEECGNRLDTVLASRYAHLMNTLSPLISSEHQTGQLDVDAPGEPDGLVLSQGALTRRNVGIIKRDEKTRKPRSAIAGNAQDIRNLAKSVGWGNGDFRVDAVPPISGDTIFIRGTPSVCAELEIAALKSAMLTFDHLLRGNANRFTRHCQLEDVRAFVKVAAADGKIDSECCNRYSLGLQYEKVYL